MLAKRIIPCLDIKNGRTVKGTNFIRLRDVGDPVELAVRYCQEGADELVFLDISATEEKRKTLARTVRDIALHINIPFTVGGGVNTISDVSILLENGADKISVNSAAVIRPGLIDELAGHFGSQCIVTAIDAKKMGDDWKVVINGGKTPTTLTVTEWALEVSQRGAGEILLTSMDHDGVKNGFAVDLTRTISDMIPIPVIASGGAGSKEHFAEIFKEGFADASLAASVFHLGEIPIPTLKEYLSTEGINIRNIN